MKFVEIVRETKRKVRGYCENVKAREKLNPSVYGYYRDTIDYVLRRINDSDSDTLLSASRSEIFVADIRF